MIVVCPSCHTRYRHGSGAAATAALAECSLCEERFELAPARRTYVIRGNGHAATPSVPSDVARSDAASAAPLAPPPEVSFTPAGPTDMPPPTVEWSDSPGDEAAPPEPVKAKRAGSTAAVELLIAILPAVAGAGLAYDLAGRQHEDPITWAALGGAVGLLLGWACLLWIGRKD